jgi:hypothetical protein
MEMFAGRFVQKEGIETMTNAILSAIEEGMEMIGIAVFIYAMQKYKNSTDQLMATKPVSQSEYFAS